MAGRQARGGRRPELKQIENENSRVITFSKRKASIYKKASELVTLCGAKVAFIAFSPSGNPFSFADPSIEEVANRFLNRNAPSTDRSQALVESFRRAQLNELSRENDELQDQIKAEKAKAKVLKRLIAGKGKEAWWETPIEELDGEELHKSKGRMEELRRSLLSSVNQQGRGEASSSFQGQDLEK